MGLATLERITSRTKPTTFLEREFPNGRDAKFLVITPGIARELLANNPNNRRVSKAKMLQYAADIAAGRWQLNGEAIIIASDGNINTGQKRLMACVEANTPFETLVVYGVERDTRDTVDTGQPQSAGDKLTMHEFPNAKGVAAMAKMAVAYERSNGRSIRSEIEYVSQLEALEYVAQHGDDLVEAFRLAHGKRSYKGLASESVMGIAAYILRNHGSVARQYLTELMTGENIGRENPAYRVRERLSSMGRGNRPGRLEAILRGWMFYRDGKPMTLVKITGELPAI